jgi:uncharacterized coiled-coil protein SlyX
MTSAVERYREHEVWEMVRLKLEALGAARYSTEELETFRRDATDVLTLASRSKDNPTPVLYDGTLNQLRDTLNALSAEEGQFQNFMLRGNFDTTVQLVRQLPGPPPRQVNQRYVDALDSSIAQRESTIAELRDQLAELTAAVEGSKKSLEKLSTAIDTQNSKITADAATITQVANSAAEQLRAEWETKLASWDVDRAAKDQKLDEDLTSQIQLLAGSAVVGQRLVEHAAGLLTATEWASRAKRERLNAIWLRWGSLVAFVGALGTGGYILWHAIDRGFELTVGDGILRGALVLALVGVGTFLSSEARRHFKEADSAEEVTLALTAIEPFYAGSSSEDRASARKSVGDTVFVKNVLSRFANRDATKHANTTNQELSEVADLLTKGAAVAKNLDPKA